MKSGVLSLRLQYFGFPLAWKELCMPTRQRPVMDDSEVDDDIDDDFDDEDDDDSWIDEDEDDDDDSDVFFEDDIDSTDTE